MSYIITIQYPYQYLTITLSDTTKVLSTHTISKFQAISQLIPAFQNLLTEYNLTLADIACIGVNTGPGPFNTLRSIIATANGISFATGIPLVDCNGLELMLQEQDERNTVAILDAFGTDVYFAMKFIQLSHKASAGTYGEMGYDSIKNVIADLNNSRQKEITFVGNGAIKYKELIMNEFDGTAVFIDDYVFASTQALVDETYRKFSQGQTDKEIFPLYFASPVVKS
ncbi:MAG: tRNA (adenosine(37)-N6)-threonylcarbamoyltransferase complex dimerization subunit type 1 TsaB [Candidatus Chromulinivorax sp.]|nr:tRNA (adenosine(37)-N6)-threonylcarbamoyltransferase complex dimerization subunit type 1 TsaB [Candidatus Chromulinivorax sp.]